MGFVKRNCPKTQVAKAGQRIAKGAATENDWEILANWRGVHTYVLNSFQSNIRRLIDRDVHQFAQRLKRKNTIVNKLCTGRAKDLATMHDIAGCRIICNSIHDLQVAQKRIHGSRAQHQRLDKDKYDYISSPKKTGYRGIHDVFAYKVSGSSGEHYNGLKVEIQYRTKVQHAWATALEISDLIDNTRVKFDQGESPRKERFFMLASEFLARQYEGMKGCLPELTDQEILIEMEGIEAELHIMRKLNHAQKKTPVPKSRNIVLHFAGDQLIVKGYRSTNLALQALSYLEREFPQDDIVYVRADDPTELQSAFRNYFTNSKEFLKLMPKLHSTK